MVALTVLYNVGARDEDPALTGMAHLMEHLMFSGDIDGGAAFDDILEQAGGTSNAWTSSDFTCFYEILPAVNAATAFWLESRRMSTPVFSPRDLEIQRSVVTEEFKQQCLNVPYGDIDHLMRRLAYVDHPYRWPVIGDDISHLSRMTIDHLRDFHRRFYSPANAVVAVTGNISLQECRRLAMRWLAPVAPRPVAQRPSYTRPAAEPPARYREITAPVPNTMLVTGWLMPGYGTPGYYACDALTDILSNGRSARFNRLLPSKPSLIDLDAAIYGSEDTGMLIVQTRLADDTDATFTHARELINNEIANIATQGPDQHEVDRAINKYTSQQVFNDLHFARRGVTLARALMHNESPDASLKAYRSLTPARIARAAQSLTPDQAFTLRYRAK